MQPTAASRTTRPPDSGSPAPATGSTHRRPFMKRLCVRLVIVYGILVFATWNLFGTAIRESLGRTTAHKQATRPVSVSTPSPLTPEPPVLISPLAVTALLVPTARIEALGDVSSNSPSPLPSPPPSMTPSPSPSPSPPHSPLPPASPSPTPSPPLVSPSLSSLQLVLSKPPAAFSIRPPRMGYGPSKPLLACRNATPCHIMVEVVSFIAGERFSYDKLVKCDPNVECHWCSAGTCPTDRTRDAQAFDIVQSPDSNGKSEYLVTLGATMESGEYMGGQLDDSFGNFDVVMSMNPKSDVPLVYLAWGDQLPLPQGATPSLEGRQLVAAFVASNCEPRRKSMVERLITAGLQVHALGGCVPTGAQHHRIVSNKHPYAAKVEALLKYAIYLAFENSVVDGYVTEKVFDGLRAGAIPVYHGTRLVMDYVPNGSIIQFDPAKDFKEQVRQIKSHLAPEKYAQLQAWRKTPFFPKAFTWKGRSSHCRGCLSVANIRQLSLEDLRARRQRRKQRKAA